MSDGSTWASNFTAGTAYVLRDGRIEAFVACSLDAAESAQQMAVFLQEDAAEEAARRPGRRQRDDLTVS